MPDEVDLGEAASELAAAAERMRERSGRAYPTWSEILELLRELGYRKADDAGRPPGEAPGAGGRCYLVLVDADDPVWAERIAILVASLGGRAADGVPVIFVFASETARDGAIDAVSHAFGRGAASPAEGSCETWWPAPTPVRG